MAIPITAKIKKSPLKKMNQASGSIDPDNPTADVFVTQKGKEGTKGAEGTPDKKVYSTGKSLKGLSQEQLDWRKNEIKKLGGLDAYHEKYGDKKKGKERIIKGTEGTPDTPGTPDTTAKGTLMTTKVGDVQQPWEVARQRRANKKLAKELSRSESRMAKYKDSTSRYGKRKYKEYTLRKQAAEAQYKNQLAAQSTGKRTGSSDVTTGQRQTMQSELEKPEQKALIAEREKANANKKANTFSEFRNLDLGKTDIKAPSILKSKTGTKTPFKMKGYGRK